MSFSNEFLCDFKPVYEGILAAKGIKPERAVVEVIDEEQEGIMRNPKNMLIVGIVLLVAGVCILLFNPDQSDANLEIARNAKNAQEAAAAISGNNQRELMIHMAGNFLAGIGIALTAGGFFLKRKKQ